MPTRVTHVLRAMLGMVIPQCMFSIEAYRKVLQKVGGDVDKFDRAIAAKLPKSTKGSWAPDSEKVPITRIMLI